MSYWVSRMFVRMSEMTPRTVEWVWNGLIPRGKLTRLTGDPGVGKSLVALQVAAMVTRGVTTPRDLSGTGAASTPEGEKRALAKGVLVFSAADHPENTVLPRLIAAGADPSMVFFHNGNGVADMIVDDKDTTHPELRPFTLTQDMENLGWCVEDIEQERGIDVGLIVIDPIDRYIGANDIRPR